MIGIFGGTFDPFHFGHLNCALSLKESCGLSEVWVIPTCCSPFRQTLISPEHRFEMAKLGISGVEGFKILDIEVKKKPPTYTIDTLLQLKEEFPNKKFALLLGEDADHSFADWKDSKKILELVPVIKAKRGHELKAGFVNIPFLEISATTIRDRLKKGLYCGHLVPSKVLDYIYKNRLYYNG